MKINNNFLTLGNRARSGTKFTKLVTKIVIHWIGPYPTHNPSGIREWWEKGSDGVGVQASAHFIVKESECLQCLPLDEIGWHSGDQRNYESIGIEVVPMNKAGEFSKTTIDTLHSLIKHIREEVNSNLTIERHFDGVQKKDCPRFYTSVTKNSGVDARIENPEGGDKRWEDLKLFLNDWDRTSPRAG
ncbi:MAG: peptidoglycan recognition protein family protein [Treponema sp.]|nr:peptidoglycan recognition protein family protein [Treponema sp.]